MPRNESCFRDFPNQCEGCPEYRVRRYESALPLISILSMGLPYVSQHKNAVVKECKLHHKRKVEPLE